ncbi:CoA activase [candidate division LCP-89 bacterium B3_LCP]|uniref:CoA activase n=1 Tax=candidate division LCP-89 bacterium B3_LCP TaxID=2012998 RepID=A0A532UYP2_UNCL8|nr:MAG: CoA activase [candidate division LCP-89 bacterium B3_LCP]
MTTAGIDMGAKNIRVLILKDGEVIARAEQMAGFDTAESAEIAFNNALGQAGINKDQIDRIVATGAGRESAPLAQETVTDVGAAAKGGNRLIPQARTIIDVGAEEGRAIKTDAAGKVMDFAVNEKCAAGAGSFTEAMSRALEVQLEEFGPLSLKSSQTTPMNAQCAVFAESEVVSLLHAKTPKQDIARAVHDAIADRIVSMVRRVGIEPEVALVGAVSRNVGFVDSLKRGLERDVIIPDDAEFVGALGAALVAAEG